MWLIYLRVLKVPAYLYPDVYKRQVLFVVQMETARLFRPNWRTHSAFGDALRQAREAGVAMSARCCRVTPDSLILDEEIPMELSKEQP